MSCNLKCYRVFWIPVSCILIFFPSTGAVGDWSRVAQSRWRAEGASQRISHTVTHTHTHTHQTDKTLCCIHSHTFSVWQPSNPSEKYLQMWIRKWTVVETVHTVISYVLLDCLEETVTVSSMLIWMFLSIDEKELHFLENLKACCVHHSSPCLCTCKCCL